MPLDDLRSWIGRTQTVEDFVAPWPMRASGWGVRRRSA